MTRCEIINKILEAKSLIGDILNQDAQPGVLSPEAVKAIYDADVALSVAHVKTMIQ